MAILDARRAFDPALGILGTIMRVGKDPEFRAAHRTVRGKNFPETHEAVARVLIKERLPLFPDEPGAGGPWNVQAIRSGAG
jgi:hypothetical protein